MSPVGEHRLDTEGGHGLKDPRVVTRHHHASLQPERERAARDDANERLAAEGTKRLLGESGRPETGRDDTKEVHGGS